MTTDGLHDLGELHLAAALGVPRVALFARVGSTMDEAHELAASGTSAGTIVIADEQTAGRGRGGRRWNSAAVQGLWITLLERPDTGSGLEVLSLRLGVRVAPVLDRFTDGCVHVKWPNDLFVGSRKLAGILVEARWRGRNLEWVAIGIGINLAPSTAVPNSAAVRPGVSRLELLDALVPAIRAAAAAEGSLSPAELAEFDARDYARGRHCALPADGVAEGITSDGALVIRSSGGTARFRSGSLQFAGEIR